MMRQRVIEGWVGFFMLVGAAALLMLALKVSGLTSLSQEHTYNITADFLNVGSLKPRAPIKMAGVKVGEVTDISLSKNYQAKVVLAIDEDTSIPSDSTARIYTAGLLGSQYVSISNGNASQNLPKDGSARMSIFSTQSPYILEDLIGKLIAGKTGK